MRYILFNPLANNKQGEKIAKEFVEKLRISMEAEQYAFRNIVKTDCRYLLESLYPDDEVFIVGGGGTILRFAQTVQGMDFKNNMFFVPSGVGNDFFNDIAKPGETYTLVNDYIKKVHYATLNDKKVAFLTDIGLGVDGYSCVQAAEAREKDGTKKFNYSGAVIKGLLGKYKPCGCSIIVDGGEEEYFEHVWIASTMAGTSYGGGVKIAPTYDRLKADYLECIIYTAPTGLSALMKFPAIMKGKHEGKLAGSHVFRGKKIEIYFTSPRDAQIDGEPYSGIQRYVAEF